MTLKQLEEDAHAVLLPASDRLDLSEEGRRFLDAGGRAWLMGESRAEYVARRMSPERMARETVEDFLGLSLDIRRRAGAALIAVDQEPGGINRLEGLVPDWPVAADLMVMPGADLKCRARRIAASAHAVGVNMFLAPIMDRVTGPNPWLAGRTVSQDPARIAEIGAAMVRGIQSAGVVAVAKHFPGFAHIPRDPAIKAAAIEASDLPSVIDGMLAFDAVIAADVKVVMVGPAIVSALDPLRPALLSPAVIQRLTCDLGFCGIVLADDLDSKATLAGARITTVAVEALAASADKVRRLANNRNTQLVQSQPADA